MIESVIQRRAEEERQLSSNEGKPDSKEGARFEIKRIEDVRNHEADDEGCDDRFAAEVEEEGGCWDESDGHSGVVDK